MRVGALIRNVRSHGGLTGSSYLPTVVPYSVASFRPQSVDTAQFFAGRVAISFFSSSASTRPNSVSNNSNSLPNPSTINTDNKSVLNSDSDKTNRSEADKMTVTIYRKDYQPPAYAVPEVHLNVKLHLAGQDNLTRVEQTLVLSKNAATDGDSPKSPSAKKAKTSASDINLDGDECLNLLELALVRDVSEITPQSTSCSSGEDEYDGKNYIKLEKDVHYTITGKEGDSDRRLTIPGSVIDENKIDTSKFGIFTRVELDPKKNTSMMGLYTTTINGEGLLYTTQMEAEGMRKMTWFPDRPDVMSKYFVRAEAPKKDFPVILCNGNVDSKGDLPDGRHFFTYSDPHAKPCYLFALVVGDLGFIEKDYLIKAQNRNVKCRVYAEHNVKHLLEFSLDSLLKAMKFDEEFFDLEYDLDIFNIVSVRDFNMGAMENKSLNIFNEKLILASPETATDEDFERIESVVAHEYFHNWTGNRVTCRDWFQLTLKEGLTVFRDQSFSINVGLVEACSRVDQVRAVKNQQFPEDEGPLQHPVRPDSYQKIDNFYTATVYEKGAEVIRMYWTILGEAGFKRGLKLYFQRHDGTAATCDDFLAAMQDASPEISLDLFKKWLSTKGTPELLVERTPSSAGKVAFKVKQGQYKTDPRYAVSEIMHIPLAYGLINKKTGKEIVATKTFHLKEKEAVLELNIPSGVSADDIVPSLNRGFSAPIKVYFDMTPHDLAALAAYDTDMFVKWESFQKLAQIAVYKQYEQAKDASQVTDCLVSAIGGLLKNYKEAGALVVGETLNVPGLDSLITACQLPSIDPLKMASARSVVVDKIRSTHRDTMEKVFKEITEIENKNKEGKTTISNETISLRRMKNSVLRLSGSAKLGEWQEKQSINMTDKMSSLIVNCGADQKKYGTITEDMLARFLAFAKKENSAPVVDKYFAVQAMHCKDMRTIEKLVKHADFTITNPNRFRAVVMNFCANSNGLFYTDEGLQFVADKIGELDCLGNAQVAARVATKFKIHTKLDAKYATKITDHIKALLAKGVKPETKEILSKIIE